MFALFSRDTAPGLTPAQAMPMVASGDLVLIDIREPGEVQASGKAQGAHHVPMATLAMRTDPRSPDCLPELKSGKPVALYCASGARSAMARQTLLRLGHAEVHNLGGLAHWAAAGGVVVPA